MLNKDEVLKELKKCDLEMKNYKLLEGKLIKLISLNIG